MKRYEDVYEEELNEKRKKGLKTVGLTIWIVLLSAVAFIDDYRMLKFYAICLGCLFLIAFTMYGDD